MGDSFGRIITILIGVVLMFFVPLTIISVKQDDTKQALIDDAVVEFVDNARAAGEISPSGYKQFVDRINAAHQVCNINIAYEASHEVPVPRVDAGGNIIGYDYKRALQTYNADDITNYMFYETDPAGNVKKNASGYPIDLQPPIDFPLKEGGYLAVEVTNITPTLGTQMLRLFLPRYTGTALISSYSGYVGNNKQ